MVGPIVKLMVIRMVHGDGNGDGSKQISYRISISLKVMNTSQGILERGKGMNMGIEVLGAWG